MAEDAHEETMLSDGTWLKVSVSGADDIARKTRLALAAAAGAVAEATDRPKTDDDINETGIVGQSAPMKELFRMLDRIRSSNATVLVLGENGTGKELVAKAIHRMSKRRDKRFVATNCSAFNDNLLESELFGHKRGSFTGAVHDKPGLFNVADEGTFFLDEVGDMSPALQVKLLRVLQEGVFMPVGATETKRVDVRIIAATNRDLREAVRSGAFRADLFHRLSVLSLSVPPLRSRGNDWRQLMAHFQQLYAGTIKPFELSDDAARLLDEYSFPGNVRELRNIVIRIGARSPDGRIAAAELQAELEPGIGTLDQSPDETEDAAQITTRLAQPGFHLDDEVAALERRYIREALAQCGGNLSKAARLLGVNRTTLYSKVSRLGLDAEDDA